MIVEERNYAFAPADIERFLAIYESEGVVIATHVLGNLLGYFALRSVTISTRSSVGGTLPTLTIVPSGERPCGRTPSGSISHLGAPPPYASAIDC